MTWTDCVKKLLDVYEEIADALDNLAFFHSLIKSDERFSRILEDYFSDIILFHRSVLDLFSRPSLFVPYLFCNTTDDHPRLEKQVQMGLG